MNISAILNSKIFTKFTICAFFLMLGAFPGKVFSQEKAGGKPEAFDAGKTAMEHISDKHEWHLFGEKVTLPLPIILYTDKGLDIFSSANLKPEGTAYKGKYYSYTLENDKIKVADEAGKVDEAATKKVWDFSITQNVAGMWLGAAVLLFVFLSVASAYKKRGSNKAPKGLQSVMEPVILFIRDDVARPNIGLKHERFMPLLLTVFFFILINNLFGMIPFFPGGYNLTGNIAVTFTLAFIIFLVINFNGNKHYWKHIFSPNPWWLFPIMIPVEVVGIFSKPIALMIRLFANMLAGHIVVVSLISLIFIFGTLWIAPVSVAFALFIDVIEVLVVFLQAYVFTILSALFIGMAVEEHHEPHTEVI